jgi:hypothetical protein
MTNIMLKNSLNYILIVGLACSLSGCGKQVTGKKKTSKTSGSYSERRKPQDNNFIEHGGYAPKKKTDSFNAKTANPEQETVMTNSLTPKKASVPQSTPQEVVYQKPQAKTNTGAMVAYSNVDATGQKKGFFNRLFTRIASIMQGSNTAPMVQIASKTSVYRPKINQQIVDGNHNGVYDSLAEQGSFDDGYYNMMLDANQLPFEPMSFISAKPIGNEPEFQTYGLFEKKNKPAHKHKKKSYKNESSEALDDPTPETNLEHADFTLNPPTSGEHNLGIRIEEKVNDAVSRLLSAYKYLSGIGLHIHDQSDPEAEVNIPTIQDEDLKKGGNQHLSTIPAVPVEFESYFRTRGI